MPAQVRNKVWLMIRKEHSQHRLAAHGTPVGLSDGLMRNSEVGHLNIGAWRVVRPGIVCIDLSIKKKVFHKNETVLASFKHAKDGNGRLHLIGLISDGGVHSHNTHLYALLETAKERGEYGELATVVGRYYAMDRDKRWERVKIAVDGLVSGDGAKLSEGKGVVDEIKANYEKDVTDEFLKPIIVNRDAGWIKGALPILLCPISLHSPTNYSDGNTLFFFNYCSNRMRELVAVLGLPKKPMEVTVPKDLFPFPIAFPLQAMSSRSGWQRVKQAHIAETAYIRFFFNGGVKKFMIPSPKPISHSCVNDNLNILDRDLRSPSRDPPSRTDAFVGTAHLLITANHGNAKQMRDAKTGAPHTAYTCNPVPFILAGNRADGDDRRSLLAKQPEGK
ncbi:putative phosphoglyceromutase [Mycena leptocephala]|nr:putative phosphoglyceromutase [Mycena leptocephala]